MTGDTDGDTHGDIIIPMLIKSAMATHAIQNIYNDCDIRSGLIFFKF